jgi:hypothetical protein
MCGAKVFDNSIFCEFCGNKLIRNNFSQKNPPSSSIGALRRTSHISTPKVVSRWSSPYSYTSYNNPISPQIKWLFISFFFIIVIGFAGTVTLLGFISFSTDSNIHEVNEVDFIYLGYSASNFPNGTKQFSVRIKNRGSVSAISGLVPISWEDYFYEIPLKDGIGTLDENMLGVDLNGNGDILDEFSVRWFCNSIRQWDAIIQDGLQDIHVYSIFEGSIENPGGIRTYNIDGHSKLFQLGNQTHSLYMANNDRAWFGLTNGVIRSHQSPCFELIVDSKIVITEVKINHKPVSLDYTWTFADNIVSGPWNTTAYIIPVPVPGVLAEETVTLSCTFISNSSISSDIFLYMNWSPDGYIRKIWDFFEKIEIF